ncbi:MAG: TetR/AcrR family transcriptional regulator [Actinobacteria bacterium]|nr:TetR/AcrR family transcriptional regulator [Actinomycetota bacterium]
MARPVTHDANLRSRLIEVASSVIDRDGPERFSVREVAQRAGTSTSAVYTLFGSKAELTAAVVADSFASFAQAQREAERHGLRALGEAYRAWALAHPDRYRLMFSGVVGHDGAAAGGSGSAPTSPSPDENALLPLARTLTGVENIDESTDLRSTLAVWAQVHGAVSLELAGVAPPWISTDVVYAAVLDGVQALHPGR